MLRRSIAGLAVTGFLLIPPVAGAQEFSADGVARNTHGQTARSKIYVERAQVRVEPEGGTSYEILDTAQVTGYFIVPQKKWAVEQTPEVAGAGAAPYEVGDSPCARFSASSGPLPTCRKLGTEQIAGRKADKWQIDQAADGKHLISTMWVDPALHAVIKSQSDRGTYELVNIRIGRQPDALFAIPPDYTHKEMGSISLTPAPAPKK